MQMFTLCSGHLGIAFETVIPFRLHLTPEAASTLSIKYPYEQSSPASNATERIPVQRWKMEL